MSIEKNIDRIADALEALVSIAGLMANVEDQDVAPLDTPLTRGEKANFDSDPSTTQQNTATVVLDKDDLPWDKRIHSSGKTQDKKGYWIKKRNVDAKLVASVEAELRGTGTATQSRPSPRTNPNTVANTQPDTGAEVLLDFPTLQRAAQEIVRQLGPRATEVPPILAEFGAKQLSDLQPEQYESFQIALNNLLETQV